MSEQASPDPAAAVSALAVVVPAHNEEALLPRCLTALDHAVDALRQAEPSIHVEVVLALDACTDDTAKIAGRYDVRVTTLDERCVGAARAAGAAAAADLLGLGGAHDPVRTWLACTDADSVVPPNWLTEHVALAARGTDLVLGRVRPDPADLDDEAHQEWSRLHTSTHPARHVHGANLGVRWSAYAAAGGFARVTEHEDALLVEALLADGARVAAGPEILTSGRSVGRVPVGFSGYLQALIARLAL